MPYCLLGKCFSIRAKHPDTKKVAEFGNGLSKKKTFCVNKSINIQIFSHFFIFLKLKNINIK